MKRWMKSLKPYIGYILLIVGLLIVQVFCDLSLPEHTSNIIDTGIQNYGISHVAPDKIVESEYDMAKIFMNDEEEKAWTDAYEKDGDIYSIKYTDEESEKLDELDNIIVMPIVLNSQFSSLDEETLNNMLAERGVTGQAMGITEYPVDFRPFIQQMITVGQMPEETIEQMKTTMEDKLNQAGGNTLQMSMGKAYAKKMDELAGIDINKKQMDYLWSEGGLMIVIALIMMASMILAAFFCSKVGAAVGRDLRSQSYRNVIKFSNAEIEKFSTASLITRTTNDVQQIQQTTTIALRMVLYAPLMAIFGVIKVASTGAGMGWVIALAIVAIIGILFFLMGLVMPKFKKMQKLVDNVNRVSREILTGLPVIRAFGSEKKEEERFDKANIDLYKVQVFTGKAMAFMLPAFMFIMFGLSVLIIWVGGHRIDSGAMQIGQMTAFITYSMLIVMSFIFLTVMSIIVPRAAVAAKRLDEVITTDSSIRNVAAPKKLSEPEGVVEFKNVCFGYPGAEENILEDISFVARAGETTAIIGATGCGKSTLVQLIPRLYDVTSGSITFDGTDIRELELKNLRDEVAYIPQKGILFSGTIESNIKFGKDDATTEEVERAAEIAQAKDFIEQKDEKYDTPISQGGTNVSGGQKQRLSIARALAKDSKVLIFDDSFSALDLKTDKKLRKALKANVSDSTMIVVAQRVSTIMDAEQIIVMDEGKIAGIGTHDELLKNCEVYREIAESQLTQEELYGKEA